MILQQHIVTNIHYTLDTQMLSSTRRITNRCVLTNSKDRFEEVEDNEFQNHLV